MAKVLRPVQVGLLSGRTARCDPQPSRTVCELLEEAQSKLGIGIQQLVTSSGMTLNQDFTLEEAGIDYAGHVFALASVNEDEALQTAQGGHLKALAALGLRS
ncbi:unnamed protein product, partial [Durusdinium trenchii]